MRQARALPLYGGILMIAIVGAFLMSSALVKKAHSQQNSNPAADVEIPPEFLKQMPPSAVPPKNSEAGLPTAPVNHIEGDKSSSTINFSKDEFVYDPNGKRDPFRLGSQKMATPPGLGGSIGGSPSGPNIPKELSNPMDNPDPLQRYGLTAFKVVAIMWDVKKPRAVVRDPEGATHIIGRNTKIGTNQGVVTAIREGEVVVLETVGFDPSARKEVQIMPLRK